MLGRLALAGAAALALGVSSANAGGPSILPILFLAKDCFKSDAVQVQCAIQVAKGDRNKAYTEQSTWAFGDQHQSLQLGITYQNGNDNRAHTEQIGKDQVAVTVQKGDNNSSFIGQKGKKELAVTVQVGDGHWNATAMNGEEAHAIVVQTN